MDMMRGALVTILLLASTTSCQEGIPVTTTWWSPPPKEVVDTDNRSVVVGRLWVMPNPIRVRPEWDGTTADGEHLTISVVTLGSEYLDITAMRLEGNSDFIFVDGDPGLEIGYPVTMNGSPECTSGSALTFSLAYRPRGGSMDPGTLVIETRDPTSPTMRIPIVFDTEGTLTPDDPSYPAHYTESHIYAVKPNPVRISSGRASTTDVCIIPENAEHFTFRDMRVHGEGLSLVEPVDSTNPRIEYTPGMESTVNGSLIIDFTDSWGDEHTLVVPILVR